MTSPSTIAPSLRAERLPLDQVPVVDFRPFLDGTRPAQAGRPGLAGAFRNMGFAYLAGHGVDQALIDRAFAEAGRFFAWPAERKAEVSVERSPCDRGWFDLGMENLDPDQQEEGDLKEGYRIGNDLAPDHPLVRKGVLHGPNQWPAGGPEFRQAMEDYQAPCTAGRPGDGRGGGRPGAARGLLRGLVHHPMVILSPLHYPPQQAAGGAISEARIGAGAHSDYGCLALLAQDDRGGLQVRNAAGWIDAKPVPGTFVVNVGDMLARWTNDLFPPTLHRVINTFGPSTASRSRSSTTPTTTPRSRSSRPAWPRASPSTRPRPRSPTSRSASAPPCCTWTSRWWTAACPPAVTCNGSPAG